MPVVDSTANCITIFKYRRREAAQKETTVDETGELISFRTCVRQVVN